MVITKEEFQRLVHMDGVMTPEEENAAFSYYVENRSLENRNLLVMKNDMLIWSVAKKYRTLVEDDKDLYQVGIIGLITAVERFEPERGYKFSTYAYQWIRQSISRYIEDNCRAIRLPVHINEKLYKIRQFIKEYETTHNGDTPSYDTIAGALDLPPESIEEYIFYLSIPIVSLDAPVLEGERGKESERIDFIVDEKSDPESEAMANYRKEAILEIMKDCLTEREMDIICRRFGFYDKKIETLKEIAVTYNLTRERIRQIEERAKRKLKIRLSRHGIRDTHSIC